MLGTLTGPSGVGKTSILKRLMREPTLKIRPLLSTTTRPPRPTDVDGEYQYVKTEVFRRMQEAKLFVWEVNVHGNWYGTRKDVVQASLLPSFNRLGLIVHEAVEELRSYAESLGMENQLWHIYIRSPGEETLRERLLGRGEMPEKIERRLADCRKWDEKAMHSHVPYHFLQDRNNLPEKVRWVRERFIHA